MIMTKIRKPRDLREVREELSWQDQLKEAKEYEVETA